MSEVVKIISGPPRVVVTRVGPTVPPSGGGSGFGKPPPGQIIPIDANVGIGTRPAVTFASFSAPGILRVEGDTVTVRAVLNSPSLATLAMPLVVNTDLTTMLAANYTLSGTELVWGPNQLEASITVTLGPDAAENTSRQLVIDFDAHREPLDPAHSVPAALPLYGATRQFIYAVNAAAGTPAFTLPSAALTVAEGAILDFEVTLDVPAPAPIQIRVQTSGGTAVEGVDYELLDEVLAFDLGATTAPFQVRLIDNTEIPATDPTLNIVASLLQGTANPGANTTMVLTIIDNDAGGTGGTGSPFVEFTPPLSASLLEGGASRTFTARLVSGAGTPMSFVSQTAVPVTLAGSTSAFQLTFPGQPNRLTFEAGANTASFTAAARLDSEPNAGESMTVTIQGDASLRWRVGAANQVTLISIEAGAEDNQLFWGAIDTSDGTRALRQWMMAVTPPSTTLPEYEIDGETCQVVGHRRNPAGQWVGCYVYALDSGAESIPYEGTPRLVTFPDGQALPAENATFVESPLVAIQMQLNGGAGINYNWSTADPGTVIDWTSPTGVFPQVGADLVRERIYVQRPRRVTTSGTQFEASGDLAGMIELVETRIAGEDEIVLYSGRYHNGVWRQGEDPRAENPYCDGVMQVGYLLAEMDPAWRIEVFDAHPYQKRLGTSDHRFYLLDRFNSGNHLHEFRPQDQYHFWFVARKVNATAAAIARAEAYWECRHIGWCVGPQGPTRVGLLNETGDLALDYHRAGFVNLMNSPLGLPGGGAGYRGIMQIADAQMVGRPANGLTGYRQEWRDGTWRPDSTFGRLGWWQTVSRKDGPGASGDAIDGTHALIPAYSTWYRRRIFLQGSLCRHANAMRDIATGSAGWWWVTAINEGGQFVATHMTGASAKSGANGHWHLTPGVEHLPNNQLLTTNNADLRLAPTTRAWNVAVAATPDPFAAERVSQWSPFDLPHLSRLRPGILECWISMRQPLAYRCWEENAAHVTRVWNPLPPGSQLDNRFNSSLGNNFLDVIRSSRVPDGVSDVGRGWWWNDRDSTPKSDANGRGVGWALGAVAGFYAFAETGLRDALRGQGAAASRGGRHWFNDMLEFLTRIMTPAGIPFAAINRFDVEPWLQAVMGTTDIPGRNGALPDSEDVNGAPTKGSGQKWFFIIFYQKGMHAVLKNAVPNFFGPQSLVEHMRWLDHHQAGLRVRVVDTRMRMCAQVLAGIHPLEFPPQKTGPYPGPRFSVAEMRSGVAAWPITRTNPIGNQPPPNEDIEYGPQFQKVGWSVDVSADYFNDDGYERMARYIMGLEGLSDAEYVEELTQVVPGGSQALYPRISGLGGGAWYDGYDNNTFLVAMLARIVNRYT